MDQQPLERRLKMALGNGARRRSIGRRRGLAPLELVLWLPILCFVAALMVNLGTMTTWRVRGEIVARDAVWRTRQPRTGFEEPRPAPEIWPANATMTVREAPQIAQLDDPAINHPVVRGPLENEFKVREVLRPDQGAVEGLSAIERDYPLLVKLGSYNSGEIRHPLLDQLWQAAPMNIPANVYRRIKILYELPKTEPGLPRAFEQAVSSMVALGTHAALAVLERDEDIRRYRGGYVDFHPRVQRMCELDVETVEEQAVKRPGSNIVDIRTDDGEIHLGRITKLPSRMTDFFLSMYRQAVERLEAQIEAMQQSPGDFASQIAAAEQEIAQLKEKIKPLEAYQQRMPELEQRLEEQANAAIQ
jgi:hypothetical protein